MLFRVVSPAGLLAGCLGVLASMVAVVHADAASTAGKQDWPVVDEVERQPLLSQLHRLQEAMEVLGTPFDETLLAELNELKSESDRRIVAQRLQELLDPLCLMAIELRAEAAPEVVLGDATRELVEQGWQTFLVKVINEPGKTRRLLIESPNSRPLPQAPADEVASRWLQLSQFEGQPMRPNLSGLPLEYRILQVYSRDAGEKQAIFEIAAGSEPGEESELLREWRFGQDPDGWEAMNQVELAVEDGSLVVNSTGEDPFMSSEVSGRGGPMVLRFWAKTDVEGVGQLFWWTKEQPGPDAGRQTNFLLEPGREYLYEVPFFVEGRLAGVRLDPLIAPGEMRIDWVDLYSAQRSDQWATVNVDFQCRPATPVTFRVFDAYGKPGMARFEIRDEKGQIYPAQSKRLAPDFFFQRHIYRGDGETLPLPAGNYTIECSRGPESIPETQYLTVGNEPVTFRYRVKRWIDPAQLGWWSGDHHIHAAGCLHYENPTQGVRPPDMLRHIMGEDLKVGCCLTWGPCFDYQKRFFTGDVFEESRDSYLLRYDVEVSGFGSHMSGHLNLLNLREQIYPGGESKDHWPTLGLNTLRWAKAQGAVCGPAHSSIGLSRFVGRVPETEELDGPHGLPNFNIPAYDGIGANEFIMDVAHEVPAPDGKPVPAVDFISAMNTERVAEWNMWYHVLNSGFRVRVSGETDFPCMSGERVGIGRVYVQVDGELDYQKWVQGLAAGRSYVSDGQAHLPHFKASHVKAERSVWMGVAGSELALDEAGDVCFEVQAAALLEGLPKVDVELIVNGYPVATQKLRADGELRRLRFDTQIEQSSWVAIRMFPHAHTNPIWVTVADQPVRPSVESVQWCLMGVQQCWKSKQQTYDADEQADAKQAYEQAEQRYRQILKEARELNR